MLLNLYCKIKALRATRDRGVTAVEYGLILAAIVVVIGAVVFTLGTNILGIFNRTNGAVTNAPAGP